MYVDSEGIVLRQTKTINGRRMITLLSRRYGKIGAGTSISERGKNKSALALRPFTYGRYEIYKIRENYNITKAEAIHGYYGLGEDIDRFMAASSVLELSDKMLPEEEPAPEMFRLLLDFLSMMELRKSSHRTLVAAFRIKALGIAGCAPETELCASCGAEGSFTRFSISQGGAICRNCSGDLPVSGELFKVDPGLFTVIRYMEEEPLQKLEGLSLKPELEEQLDGILKGYYAHHLGISNLRSEGLTIDTKTDK